MITVVDHDPGWAAAFRGLRDRYAGALDVAGVPVVGIEHVGSTAVPGLAAKPVIDVDIIVAAEQVEAASDVLLGLGFRPLGELGIPERWAFAQPADWPRTNTYVIVAGSLSLRNHLAVRDTLRADPELRDAYGAVKQRVAAAAEDLDAYIRDKNAIVQQILTAAGLTAAERAATDANQIPPGAGRRVPR